MRDDHGLAIALAAQISQEIGRKVEPSTIVEIAERASQRLESLNRTEDSERILNEILEHRGCYGLMLLLIEQSDVAKDSDQGPD